MQTETYAYAHIINLEESETYAPFNKYKDNNIISSGLMFTLS